LGSIDYLLLAKKTKSDFLQYKVPFVQYNRRADAFFTPRAALTQDKIIAVIDFAESDITLNSG
jgi:hypothetical protein